IYRTMIGKHMRPYGEYPKIVHDYQIIYQAANSGLRPTLPSNTPDVLVNLFKKCTDADPMVRPTCEDLITEIETIQDIYKENKEEWDVLMPRITINRNRFYRKGGEMLRGLMKIKTPQRNLREDLVKRGILPPDIFMRVSKSEDVYLSRKRSSSQSVL